MKRKIIALSLALVVVAVSLVVAGVKMSDPTKENISQGSVDTYAAPGESNGIVGDYANGQLEVATDLMGLVTDLSDIGGDIISNVGGDIGLGGQGGGIGDLIGDAGGMIGGILGGNGGSGGVGGLGGNTGETYPPQNTTGGYITIVPAATDYYTIPDPNLTVSATDSANVGETVDFAVDVNPYTKPTGELKGGDTGDGVKWIQWMFIYTRYGLSDNGITGVFDEDTMAVVKKLQKESGMVVDGIVDDEVISKIEYLYYQAIYSEPATFAPATYEAKQTPYTVEVEEDNSTAIILILISVVWILAIVLIIVIKLTKGKAKKSKARTSQPKEENNN